MIAIYGPAALIMAAHCGYLDTVRKNGTYEKIKSINNDSLDMYGRFSFEALIFNAGEALVNNAVSNVGRLFFKADSRRQSIDSINWIFYSAVYNFLTDCRCT